MATKRTHSDRTDEAPHNDEEIYSMVDVLAEQNEIEENVSAVLGGSDDKNCTYLQGYVARQALYSCRTCAVNGGSQAGVCLACCLDCHDGHELVELYTKRNFRCDCGNGKFAAGFKCKHQPDKIPVNDENVYNQNFDGKYCTCARPYPDPEDDADDEMIQCCICEDWYHGRHLGTPAPEEYSEMVCDTCMTRVDLLIPYSKAADDVVIDGSCSFKTLSEKITHNDDGEQKCAAFFKTGWRNKLCTCADCKTKMEDMKVLFLLDEVDSVESYEQKGKTGKSQYEKGMEELSKLDRVQQVEVMSGYNDMKSELNEFLGSFATSGKIVSKEDITQFFEEMKNKKRRRVMVPQNCR